MSASHGCHYCGAPLGHGNQRICRPCYVARDPWKTAASTAVGNAIAEGRLLRPAQFDCADCGGQAIWYDHRDYGKPLHVEPVCRACNFKRGPAAFPAPTSEAA